MFMLRPNRLISDAEGADRGGEAANPSLFWVSEFLWLQHPSDGESSGRRQWHLLWLQRPWPGGQRGVSRVEERACVWICKHMWVFTSMPRTKKCVTTDSCPLFRSRGLGAPLFFKIHVFLLMSRSQGVRNFCELTIIATYRALSCHLMGWFQMEVIRGCGWSCKSNECKDVSGYCSAVTEECCFYQLTSILNSAATEQHQACGQKEIKSKTGLDLVLNLGPLLFLHWHTFSVTVPT